MWLEKLPFAHQDRILAACKRALDWKDSRLEKFGDGLFHIEVSTRLPYLVYFGRFDKERDVLLGGGLKKTQSKDCQKARAIWNKLKSKDF